MMRKYAGLLVFLSITMATMLGLVYGHQTDLTIMQPTDTANLLVLVTNDQNLRATADAIYDNAGTPLSTNINLYSNNMREVNSIIGTGSGVITGFSDIYVQNISITNIVVGTGSVSQAKIDQWDANYAWYLDSYTNLVKKDGSVTWTGDDDHGGNDITGIGDISGASRFVMGSGLNVTNMDVFTGSMQRGARVGAGVATIGASSHGAQQAGYIAGRMIIGGSAYGAAQFGILGATASATNNAAGALQLFYLDSAVTAYTTSGGRGSLLLGGGTVSNSHAIVAGTGQESHGDGSISGASLWANGTNVIDEFANYVPTSRTIAVNGVTNDLSGDVSFTVDSTDFASVTNIARDPWSEVYEVFTVDGTATVSRTFSDVYYREFSLILTNETVLAIDLSTFPTNGGATFAWQVNPNGNTISVDANSIDTNSWASVTLTTNAYNDLIFRKAPYATLFKVQGE